MAHQLRERAVLVQRVLEDLHVVAGLPQRDAEVDQQAHDALERRLPLAIHTARGVDVRRQQLQRIGLKAK